MYWYDCMKSWKEKQGVKGWREESSGGIETNGLQLY